MQTPKQASFVLLAVLCLLAPCYISRAVESTNSCCTVTYSHIALSNTLLSVGILRRTSIELGSGTVSFDVSLLSDLTSQQKAIMTNLQVE